MRMKVLGPWVLVGACACGGLGGRGDRPESDLGQVTRPLGVGAWSFTTSFPTPRFNHATVASVDHLYVIGGILKNNTFLSDVQVAPINPDGTVGTWTSTTPLPQGRFRHAAVLSNGYVYVIGGIEVGYNYSAGVLVSKVDPSGALGPWVATTPLLGKRALLAAAVYNGFLYVTGGVWTSSLPDVLYAPINPSTGMVGAWKATVPFQASLGRDSHATEAYNGFLYILGGNCLSGPRYYTVLMAPIHSDGSVGAWVQTTQLPTARYGLKSLVHNGELFAMGGFGGTSFLNEVLVATLNPDGTLGSWSPSTPFATPRSEYGNAVSGSHLFVLGGWQGNDALSDVQVSTFNTPLCTNVVCVPLDQCHVAGTCDLATGLCSNPPAVGACDDGDVCTSNDACSSGVCVGQAIIGCKVCQASGDCNDQDPCTTDTCNLTTHRCKWTPKSACLDAGTPDAGTVTDAGTWLLDGGAGTDAGASGTPDAGVDGGVDTGGPSGLPPPLQAPSSDGGAANQTQEPQPEAAQGESGTGREDPNVGKLKDACGCRSSGSGAAHFAWALLALVKIAAPRRGFRGNLTWRSRA